MSVYVDAARHSYGRMIMCHMVADSLTELHAMADTIGVKRKWVQMNSTMPHYDICKAKRTLAVRAGAIEIGYRELGTILREYRAAAQGGSQE